MNGFGWSVYNDGKEDRIVAGTIMGKIEECTSIIRSMYKNGMIVEQINN